MRRRHGVIVASLVLVGCQGEVPSDGDEPIEEPSQPVDPPLPSPGFPYVRCGDARAPLPALVEDRGVYDDDSLEVLTIHLAIEDVAAFEAVNAGVVGAQVPVIFTEGTFGAGRVVPNGTLEIRGGASRQNVQKNYKVHLAKDAGLWRGQREINLNKHMWDLTRVRNKMAFDLFKTVPDFTSLRTQFVQMFVNGEDYGLYTWIEEADKRFLSSHGLDPHGQLYKPVYFYFQPIVPATAADPAQLELLIEAKANPDPDKLLRLVDAINDGDRDIDDVVDVYFNRDNLATWLAINVLLNNIDTVTQNFYLFSPVSCEGWYFLPWDYDGAWGFYGQLTEDDRPRWRSGLSNWWQSMLFKRFLTKTANVQAVHDKILELTEGGVLGDAVTAAHLARYHDVVLPYLTRFPDLDRLPGAGDSPTYAVVVWEAERDRVTTTVSRFLAEYHAVIERPMPVGLAFLPGPPLEFRWDASFDLQHDPITYDFELSTSLWFAPADVIMRQTDLTVRRVLVSSLAPGTYFWRVVIKDHKTGDSWQLPYDPYRGFIAR